MSVGLCPHKYVFKNIDKQRQSLFETLLCKHLAKFWNIINAKKMFNEAVRANLYRSYNNLNAFVSAKLFWWVATVVLLSAVWSLKLSTVV